MNAVEEIKSLLDAQGHAWEEFKKANNELIKAKAEGKAVESLEAKVETIGKAMDDFDDKKKSFEDFMAKVTAPGYSVNPEDRAEQEEMKSFNTYMRAEFVGKKNAAPEYDAEAFKHYKEGFSAYLNGTNFNSLSDDQRKAMSAGSDPDGGYLLPPAIVGQTLKKVYETSVMRQLATVINISTDRIEGLIDNGETGAGWVGETSPRPETSTPQLGKWEIEANEMYAAPKITQKLVDDAATDVEAWLAERVAEKFSRIEGEAFMTGDGVGKPRGLFSYPTAETTDDTRAWGTFQVIKTGTNGDFNTTTKIDPIFDLIGSFRDKYLQNASFLMRREVRTKLRKLRGATSDLYLWEPSLTMGQPDRLNGFPVHVDQYIPTLATGSLSLAFGDFKAAYLIVDRIGIRTIRDVYTSKPYIIYYTTKRVGAGAQNYESIKFLSFSA